MRPKRKHSHAELKRGVEANAGQSRMQNRVECRAESEKTTAERRKAEQRREQMSDESSAETRAALKIEQNRSARRRGAEAQRRKPAEFRAVSRNRNTSRNAGEKRFYIRSARAVLRVVIVATRTPIETHI